MAQFYANRVTLGSKLAKTPEGYLLCKDVVIARTGYQIYKAKDIGLEGVDPERLVKVYRRYEEVFSPAAIASFEAKTVTSPHPPIFLNCNNDEQYYKGHAQNIHQGPMLEDGEHSLIGDLLIKNSRLISQVESKSIREVSAGYSCRYEEDDNDPDIFYQTDIRGNHIALVPTGRCGDACRVLDCASDCACQHKEEEKVVESNTTTAVEEKISLGTFKEIFKWAGSLGGSRSTTDSESEAVKRNEEVAEKAKERAVKRNEDADEKEESEKKDKEKEKKEATDATAKLVRDTMKSVLDEFKEEMKKEKEKEAPKEKAEDGCTCGAEKGEDHAKDCAMMAEDADLIPVDTLSAEERPKNPIGKAVDADRALNAVMALKPLIADHGTKAEKVAFNDLTRTLKGGTVRSSDGYADLVRSRKPEDTRRAEELSNIHSTRDAKTIESATDFCDVAEHFRRKNPADAAATLADARKKGDR